MGRKITDRYANLRAALELVLAQATEPLTVSAIAATPLMRDEGFTTEQVATALLRLFRLAKTPFPIKRIRIANAGNNRWAYYNPAVLPQLEDMPRPSEGATVVKEWGTDGSKIEEPAGPPEFKFDPVDLPGYQPVTPEVNVPPGVKAITIHVGGVSIKLELDTLAGAR